MLKILPICKSAITSIPCKWQPKRKKQQLNQTHINLQASVYEIDFKLHEFKINDTHEHFDYAAMKEWIQFAHH